MNEDLNSWVMMLTGPSGDAASPEVASLEAACQRLEAQIAALQSDRDPGERLAHLERSVAELSETQARLKHECAALEQSLSGKFEERLTAIMARHEAASRQTLVADALETIQRASKFFDMPFSTMTLAQIESARDEIDRRLAATRDAIGKKLADAGMALDEHAPSLSSTHEREAERAGLEADIEGLEQQLGFHHDVKPDVFQALRSFTVDQLDTYRREVMAVRLKDARHEAARGLPDHVFDGTSYE
jgi:chromosome segregation ATPase